MIDPQLKRQLYEIEHSDMGIQEQLDLSMVLLGEKRATLVSYKHKDLVENLCGIYSKEVPGKIYLDRGRVGYEHLPEEVVETVAGCIPPDDKICGVKCALLVSNSSYMLQEGYSWHEYGKKAGKLSEAEREKRHEGLGRVFGYPQCCIEDFIEGKRLKRPSYKEFKKKMRDMPAKQQFFLDIASHVPCSTGCSDTLEIGRKRSRILSVYAPNLYRRSKSQTDRAVSKSFLKIARKMAYRS